MDSRRERIAQNLIDTLGQMSEGTGYSYNYHRIYRSDPGVKPNGFPSVLVTIEREQHTAKVWPLYHIKMTVVIEAIHKVQDNPDDGPDTACSRMIADIKAAIMEDITRGGEATDTLIVEVNSNTKFSPYVFGSLEVEVKYRHLLTDPGSGQ